MDEPARVSTGIRVLDQMLDGGLPKERAILLTGGPGTGKSTIAMEFIQEGLANGEECLFVSTEQTPDELRDGFAPFNFDLEHENLNISTLHGALRETRGGDQELVIRTLEGDKPIDDKQVPFTAANIRKYLEKKEAGDYDRIVLDSVSGLEPVHDSRDAFRRSVLDMIRLFSDDFGATTIFNAEYAGSQLGEGAEVVGGPDTVQYNAHGVIRVWREAINGDYQRFIDVMKMRGVDHETRKFKVGFSEDGVSVYPERRSQSEKFIDYEHFETGLDGLDELLGGGLVQGSGALLEHDGQAALDALFAALVAQALEDDMALTVVPRIDMKPRKLEKYLLGYDGTLEDLLDEDRLFILDMVGAWGLEHRNVFDVREEDSGLPYLLSQIDQRSAGEAQFSIINTEAKVHAIGAEESRRIRDWQEANFVSDDDILLEVHNPKQMDDKLSEFHVDAAGQVLRTEMGESGLQYLTLRKSPTGMVGTTRAIEYIDEMPFVRVRQA
jgi:KaiC/GvpD/RAD55 family RecA-like ATPase